MKKYYTSPEYKRHNSRVSRRAIRRQVKRRNKGINIHRKKNDVAQHFNSNTIKQAILAPRDFRLIDNTEECLKFFYNIRSNDFVSNVGIERFVTMSLTNVEQIDYAAISSLTAISDDLRVKNIVMRGDFPRNKDAKKFIIESGFLNHMFDERNRRFPKAQQSDLIFFEKGEGVLSDSDNRRITESLLAVVEFLTGKQEHCKPVKTILLEVCGNSIEWARTSHQQWLLGIMYDNENNKVIFTVTDAGQGILKTLHRKFSLIMHDMFKGKSDAEILKGAFEKKYGSNTQEVNRNKGLPSVKSSFERGIIKNLKVLSNNVILHFDNEENSKVFRKGSPRFKGTLYQWEMDKNCLE